ncbi:MAG: triose-phosphate isomerase [Candidatus Colwellbacteria bacterium]|nr:triose-phosphate isomerase [Candidatus Colwellbacteria bacterium]
MGKNKLIVGNWKCNPGSIRKAEILLRVSDMKGVIVCPPFPFLDLAGSILEEAGLGAQDIFWGEGAYTGEVSASQLKGFGVKYCIIGHSERRAMGEMDDIVGKKVKAAISAGISPIVCVGESATIRKRGPSAVKKFISTQVEVVKKASLGKGIIFAYEPIWAIGTGLSASPHDAEMMGSLIRSVFRSDKASILYGGSVNSMNVAGFINCDGVDGVLVGGASADPKEFKKLLSVIDGID